MALVREREHGSEIRGPNDVSPVRIWLRSEDDAEVVQLQRERFLCNWRKTQKDHKYPRYHRIIERFWSQYRRYEEFVLAKCSVQLEPDQYELTYINHIPQGRGWDSLADLASVFRDLSWRSEDHSFLPVPERVAFNTSFVLPGSAGRLHVSLQTASLKQDGTPVLVLELTARGFSDNRVEWFDRAHTWIVKGFEDLTQLPVQKDVWRKHDSRA